MDKEFITKYTLDYKTYKEFSRGYIATKKLSIIMSIVLFMLLIIYICTKKYDIIISCGIIIFIIILIVKLTGRNKLQYKRYKSLNNDEDMENTVKITKSKILTKTKKGDITNYEFSQIIGLIETKNLLILKLNYNMGLILNKNNITGGTKEELINYLLSVCTNIKKKKLINSKKWLITRKIFFVSYIVIFIIALFCFYLQQNKVYKYQEILEKSGYDVEIKESAYNNHNTKKMVVHKNEEHTWNYIYEFGTEADAKRNIEYWANLETDNDIKEEYIIKNDRNYQKYVIDNESEYIVLIRIDKFVFYSIGNTNYKKEIDNIMGLIGIN